MHPGLFDQDERLSKLEQLGDPLPQIQRLVNWEAFRALLESAWPVRSPTGGRPPYDAVLMFKVLVLQHLYNLSDEQVEYQIRDRHSFSRFIGLHLEDRVPDAKTVWLYRERLRDAQLTEAVFGQLLVQIDAAGFVARKGQIIDAAMVAAPRQHNRRPENQQIKAGEVPTDWSVAKRRQKDVQARWAKKYGVTHFGYKNHVNADVAHQIIRRYTVSDAARSESRVFDELLDPHNRRRAVWADAAYRSRDRVKALTAGGYRAHLQRQAQANAPLTPRQRATNRHWARVRCHIEHVFAQQRLFQQRLVRTIGLARAEVKIGLFNLGYNLRRWVFLQRRRHLSTA